MSDLTFPSPTSENMELAAANRRLTTAILGMTLLTGLIACLSYLAGRTVTQMRTETATVIRTEIAPGPLVVTPLTKPSPAAMPSSNPIPTAVADATASSGLYLQVGLMNPAVDRSMQEKLVSRGYGVQLAPMENSSLSRVLVGPIDSPEQQLELESKLSADGFQYFRKRL